MRYYASLKATTLSSYNCFGYWGHLHIFGKRGGSLGRVICSTWGEWLSGICHFDQSPVGTQLAVETQPLQVTFRPIIDGPNAMINIR